MQSHVAIEIRIPKGPHDALLIIPDHQIIGRVFGVLFADRVSLRFYLFLDALHPFPNPIVGLHTAHHARH